MRSESRSMVLVALVLSHVALPGISNAESSVESNVIYEMHSGLALLMDVHYPDNANGYGIVFVPGSGWTAPMSPDADPLKSGMNRTHLGGQALLEAGYTVFSINHRAAPNHFYPAPVEDAQRAVRFVRYNAARFRINPDRIGALGGSSGGQLALLLAVMDNEGQLESAVLLLAPIVPHICHTLRHALGQESAVIDAGWPQVDDVCVALREMLAPARSGR